MALRIITILLTAILSLSAVAQNGRTDTMTGVFSEYIRSLQVRVDGDDLAAPIIVMGTDDVIRIDFDQLAEDRKYLRYSLTHCNANWQPSGLVDSEFLDGFNEGTIDNYDFSRATTVHYVHYSLTIPNQDVAPTISGNYLLKIYNEEDPETTLLQCRFMVCEGTAPVAVGAASQTDIDYNKTHQQLSISVDTERAGVEDPFNDLIVVAGQNGRLDSEIAIHQPLKMLGKRAVFEHQMPLIFDAGNEYRRFEIVSDTYPGMGVDHIEYHQPYYHYVLDEDGSRTDEPYVYDQTQAGRYIVRRSGATDSDVDADYGVVHFTLDYPYDPRVMIFIDGDMTLRRFDDNARMQYNPNTGKYERALLLKQGLYNYQYLIVPQDARRGYTNAIEGDKYQTVNRYDVRVYHRRRGERYDRLIGFGACRTDI